MDCARRCGIAVMGSLPIRFRCGSSSPIAGETSLRTILDRACPAERACACGEILPTKGVGVSAIRLVRRDAGSGAGCRSGIAVRCCYAAAPQPDPGPMHTASLSKAGLSQGSSSPEAAPGIAADARGVFRSYVPLMLAAVAAITAARLVWLAVQPADLYPGRGAILVLGAAAGLRLLLEAAADRLADRADNFRLRRRRVRDPSLGPAAACRCGGVRLCDRSAAL